MGRAPTNRKPPAVLVTLGGEAWKVIWARVRGCWGVTCYGDKEIRLDPSCRPAGKEREIFLHECMHAMFPTLDEEVIAEAGKELDEALDAMGF